MSVVKYELYFKYNNPQLRILVDSKDLKITTISIGSLKGDTRECYFEIWNKEAL